MSRLWKGIFIFLLFLLLIVFLIWSFKTSLVAHIFSKEIGTPVSIEKFEIDPGKGSFQKFHLANPPPSKTPTALMIKTIDVFTSLKKMMGEVFTIDTLSLEDIDLYVEYYTSSEETSNWTEIFKVSSSKEKTRKTKKYLIKNLFLKNLSLSLIYSNGTQKTFPVISQLEFHNISEESGMPFDEIEKAIFKKILEETLRKFNLKNIFKNLNPLKVPELLPKILPFSWNEKTLKEPSESKKILLVTFFGGNDEIFYKIMLFSFRLRLFLCAAFSYECSSSSRCCRRKLGL